MLIGGLFRQGRPGEFETVMGHLTSRDWKKGGRGMINILVNAIWGKRWDRRGNPFGGKKTGGARSSRLLPLHEEKDSWGQGGAVAEGGTRWLQFVRGLAAFPNWSRPLLS